MKKPAVRKLDVSSLGSNLLIVSAVLAAAAPVVLGDQLVLIVYEVFSRGTMLLQEVSISLQRLLS
jgi:hypothetical protein